MEVIRIVTVLGSEKKKKLQEQSQKVEEQSSEIEELKRQLEMLKQSANAQTVNEEITTEPEQGE
ncbi:MAG: hypothetical protein MJ072_00765 [Clostridia bacterium]|nr:hypothetical protein [Clostridia bacterium]